MSNLVALAVQLGHDIWGSISQESNYVLLATVFGDGESEVNERFGVGRLGEV